MKPNAPKAASARSKASSASSAKPRVLPSHEQIAARAQELWRAEGCPQGCDEEIWLEAEKELLQKGQNLEPGGRDKRPSDEPALGFNPKNRDLAGELDERFSEATGGGGGATTSL